MKLSFLAYYVVKNVKYLQDSSFTYESFRKGEYDNDDDYANSINNLFSPLNEAIHRLSDRRKIKSVIECMGTLNNDMYLPLDSATKKIKKILNVFYLCGSKYVRLDFREIQKNLLFISINEKIDRNTQLFIQYLEDIKHFTYDDIYYKEIENPDTFEIEVVEDNDVDLYDYGINETMCSYIIEYCQGKLQETIAPELANLHLTRAEQYFDDLDDQETLFTQNIVQRRYRI